MLNTNALRHEIVDAKSEFADMLLGADTSMMTSVSASMMTSVSVSMMTSVSVSMMTSVSQDIQAESDLSAKFSGLQTCLMTSVSDI